MKIKKGLELVSRPHFSYNFLIKNYFVFCKNYFIKLFCINWPNFITRLRFLPKLFNNMFRASCLGIWWRHDIWISKMLKSDYLKNAKSFRREIKSIFLVSPLLFFRHTKQTSKNVADTTFKPVFKIGFFSLILIASFKSTIYQFFGQHKT